MSTQVPTESQTLIQTHSPIDPPQTLNPVQIVVLPIGPNTSQVMHAYLTELSRKIVYPVITTSVLKPTEILSINNPRLPGDLTSLVNSFGLDQFMVNLFCTSGFIGKEITYKNTFFNSFRITYLDIKNRKIDIYCGSGPSFYFIDQKFQIIDPLTIIISRSYGNKDVKFIFGANYSITAVDNGELLPVKEYRRSSVDRCLIYWTI